MPALLIPYTPPVTEAAHSSKGFTVVSARLQAFPVARLMTIPKANGRMPRTFDGRGLSLIAGSKKWSTTKPTMATNSQLGGSIFLPHIASHHPFRDVFLVQTLDAFPAFARINPSSRMYTTALPDKTANK
jgi:hypothetical protein